MTNEKHIPGKRIKSMHRAAKKEGVGNGLRSFARALASNPKIPGSETARLWIAGKHMKAEV